MKIVLLAAGLTLIGMEYLFAEEVWQIKPIEIIEGKPEPHAPLVTAENQDWSAWKVGGNMKVELARSPERKLWRETTMKLAWTRTDKSRPGTITLTPAKPLAIPRPV